jgi:hypothetical protein
MWTGFVLVVKLVTFESPKFQLQFVIAVPVELSVKVTAKGAVPLRGVPVKLATGAPGVVVTLI